MNDDDFDCTPEEEAAREARLASLARVAPGLVQAIRRAEASPDGSASGWDVVYPWDAVEQNDE